MKQQEAIAEIGKRIVPILEEFGVEGFCMAGYIECDDQRLERFAAACTPKDNAAINDGLSKLAAFQTLWAADNLRPIIPPTDEKG